MAERKWTDEQSLAIRTRDKTLLVSAAAGSGKTATLTERIIRSVCDEESPTDISQLLVVTFTNAAAAEMRERITKALREAIEKRGGSPRLEKQLLLLPMAKIRTIDSFCIDILRSNTDRVGISPSFRIIDKAEEQLLAYDIAEGMINAIYDGLMPHIASAFDFEELADCMTSSKRTGELADVFYALYENLSCSLGGVGELLPLCELFSPESFSAPENTRYGEFLIKSLRDACDYFICSLKAYKKEAELGSAAEREYCQTLEDDILRLSRIKECDSYLGISELLSAKAASVPAKKRGEELTELQADIREKRKKFAYELNKFKNYFSFSKEDWQILYTKLYKTLSVLHRFLEKFHELFLAEKKKRSAFAYHDIERFVYECLWCEGELTDIALSARDEYRAVYIDEYQDVNALQDKIFEAISTDCGRFMVGDIKQSIYSFRSAKPDIFATMKRSFPKFQDSEGSAFSIFMSNNFRCSREIIDFVNGIFDSVFSIVGDSISYEQADRLIYSKNEENAEKIYPEVWVISEECADGDTESLRSSLQPDAVAEKISELLSSHTLASGEPIMPSDIAIIMRNNRGRDADFADALKSRGIPCATGTEKSFFLNREVLLALCLMNTIDNPRRDIYFAGLLRSPLFDFSADELFLISKRGEGESLYERLRSYSESFGFEKGLRFLERLKSLRALCESSPADAIIYRLYHETGLLPLAIREGTDDNLMLLYSYARRFEAEGYKGLSSFIGFINAVIERGTVFDTPKGEESADAVKIITAHSSKGLEFPVVFLVDTEKSLTPNRSRDASKVSYDEDFGISYKLRTPSGLGVVESPVDTAIKEHIKQKRYEEELRVLYVALTRARERLFVVGSVKGEADEYIKAKRELATPLTPFSLRKLSSSLDIILGTAAPAKLKTFDGIQKQSESDTCAEEEPQLTAEEGQDTEKEDHSVLSVSSEEILSRLNFVYPNEHLTQLPAKMSVSRLYPTVLDGADERTAKIDGLEQTITEESDEHPKTADAEPTAPKEKSERRRILPSFVTGKPADESAKRGIATHLFMQFCNLEGIKEKGSEQELDRLVREGFISEADRARVRLEEIKGFEKSELLAEMLLAKRLWREFRFNTYLPACLFTEDEERKRLLGGEKVFVQGVIDCIIERQDGTLALIDYKTDRLTREELADIRLAKSKLKARHETQLYYYSLAIERIFGKKPDSVGVYSLPLGKTVDILD